MSIPILIGAYLAMIFVSKFAIGVMFRVMWIKSCQLVRDNYDNTDFNTGATIGSVFWPVALPLTMLVMFYQTVMSGAFSKMYNLEQRVSHKLLGYDPDKRNY
jgi:hypothetical protein